MSDLPDRRVPYDRPMRSMTVEADDQTRLHVAVTGSGPGVVVLSGGPGCVHYLEDEAIAPGGMQAWYPEPRGVGRSGGGPHGMDQAVADLEAVRRAAGLDSWVVLGHSWGADLAVRYALDHPARTRGVVAVAGHGFHKDRSWSQVYESLKGTEPAIEIQWEPAVHRALMASFLEWIHEPDLFRRLADCTVPMTVIAAADDIRPSWPLRQLAALVPRAAFLEVPDVPHDFWSTHPQIWVDTVTEACRSHG
jgi:proline iminopeptidase